MNWHIEHSGKRLSFVFSREESTQITVRLFGRQLAFEFLSREDAEQAGYIEHGKWAMDGKRVALTLWRNERLAYHPQVRRGLLIGSRAFLATWTGRNPCYDNPDAQAIRKRDEQKKAQRRAAAQRETWERIRTPETGQSV